MLKNILTILFIKISLWSFGQTQPLFKITQNDRVGYIDKKGTVAINPVFINGNDFSEGLAAVRRNGLYGFINEGGIFVIKPAYDFATNFEHGLAVVYKDETPLLIDKSGNVVLSRIYAGINLVDSKRAIITTQSKKQGLIDVYTKQLLLDTIVSSIGAFNNGVSIVYEYTKPTKERKKKRIGLIDSTGRLIVPFGKYESIKPFHDGYALVEITDKRNKEGNTEGVIDTKGNLIFKRPYKNNSYIEGDFQDGYAKVSLYKYWIPEEEEGVIATSDKSYEGFINLKGEVVFNDTNYRYVKALSNGRAFIKAKNGSYILVDKIFRRIGNNEFEDIPGETFNNNYAVVKTSDGFGIIDTLGNFVTRSNYGSIDRTGVIDGYFFFSNERDESRTVFGIADLKGNIIVKPIMQQFDRNGFVNDLIKAIVNDRLSYINKSGDIVWQQQDDSSSALKPLNIDFMNRGYFYAYSTPKNAGGDNSGGWATSNNKPKKINEVKFQGNSLSITIDTNSLATFAGEYLGCKLFISNTTTDTIKMNAQDSRLYIKLQAQNEEGLWKDIEYLPSSWCGNSYHTIELEPNAFWEFAIPTYHGEFQTKIRAALRYIDNSNKPTESVVYSNIINGSINPGQFWNKRTYYPGGIMDPYND